tara:strand:+ start:1235 stop:1468 length:234 start_codon:yes stop_codon:yes gene_type:complete
VNKFFIALIFIAGLPSCTTKYASNGEQLYLKSQNGPKLVIPATLAPAKINHYYDLPNPVSSPNVSIMPPSLQASARK